MVGLLQYRVERQVQLWFEPAGGIEPFLPDKFPIWIWETKDGAHPYGLPALEAIVCVDMKGLRQYRQSQLMSFEALSQRGRQCDAKSGHCHERECEKLAHASFITWQCNAPLRTVWRFEAHAFTITVLISHMIART